MKEFVKKFKEKEGNEEGEREKRLKRERDIGKKKETKRKAT